MILHIRFTAAEMCFKEETGMSFDLTCAIFTPQSLYTVAVILIALEPYYLNK